MFDEKACHKRLQDEVITVSIDIDMLITHHSRGWRQVIVHYFFLILLCYAFRMSYALMSSAHFIARISI